MEQMQATMNQIKRGGNTKTLERLLSDHWGVYTENRTEHAPLTTMGIGVTTSTHVTPMVDIADFELPSGVHTPASVRGVTSMEKSLMDSIMKRNAVQPVTFRIMKPREKRKKNQSVFLNTLARNTGAGEEYTFKRGGENDNINVSYNEDLMEKCYRDYRDISNKMGKTNEGEMTAATYEKYSQSLAKISE
jgi:hypothetical protein